jgi:peptide/nickel transport system substrate-binding protein
MDPHRIDDVAALFFSSAVFDALFATDGSGGVVPALAEGLPEATPQGVRVVLREGLRFASGAPLTTHDVVRSLTRARSLGGRAWLDPLGGVKATKDGAILFGARGADRVAHLLASPLAAVVPERFSPERPVGTGPFAVERGEGGALVLRQNRYAATGPSVLDRVTLTSADDLATSLRAFESGADDLGWLGLGLHDPRRGAVSFDAGVVGWAVVRTGSLAGRWSLPGVAQRLLDGIDPSRLAHLGNVGEWTPMPSDGWGGAPSSILVRADCAWLVELAKAVAAALSRPDHEVVAEPTSAASLASVCGTGAYALAMDVVRPFDRTLLGASVALSSADDPVRGLDWVRHPPLGTFPSPRAMGRLLHLGVASDIRLAGGKMPGWVFPAGASGVGIDFGSIMHSSRV